MKETIMRNILADGHDEDAWRGALAESPTLRRVRDDGAERFDGFGDVLADLYNMIRQPTPRWAPSPQPTLHDQVLRDLADLSEFRELRAMADGDADNAALATCILGRKLAHKLDQVLADLLAAEFNAYATQGDANGRSQVAEDLAVTIGDDHPAVIEARVIAELALAGAAVAVRDLPDPAAVEDLLAAFRRDARAVVRDASTVLGQVAEASGVFGGGTNSGLAAKLLLADKMVGSAKFNDLVAIAGRIKRVALECRAAVVKDVPPEVIGVTVGRDIQRALPAELALLAMPITRPLFYKKFAEGQLMLHEQRGEEKLGSGPIVVCLDGSGSMAGPREVWSKAVTLGYLAIAARERRDVVVGQFGATGQIEVNTFPYRGRPDAVRQADVLAAMERFLDAGGTDLEGALRWAIAQVGTDSKFTAADIVVLTDAEANLSDAFLSEWRQAQARLHFRSYAVLIGDVAGARHLGRAIQTVIALPDLAADGAALQGLFGLR